MWWYSIRPDESLVTIAGQEHPQDDVAGWLFALRRLNAPGCGLLADLEGLANGRLPSRFATYQPNPRIKIETGAELPKRIRLAHALGIFRHATSSSTVISRADVDAWIDADRVKAYQSLDIELKEEIFQVAGQLEFALRRRAFAKALERFTPTEFMQCVLDVLPILVQAGKFQNAMDNSSPLLAGERLTQIFDLFQLAESPNAATDIFDVRFSADGSIRWGQKQIKTRSDADELKATAETPAKLLDLYKFYRDHVLQALILRKVNSNVILGDFRQVVGDLVKQSTVALFPAGALDDSLPMDEFKARAEEIDAGDPSRWRKYDSLIASNLDRAATSTTSLLGIIYFYIAVEKVVSEPELTESSLRALLVAGLGMVDDGLARAGALSVRLLGDLGKGLESHATKLSTRFVQRALFVFAILDVAVQVKSVASSTTKSEVVGNALMLAGSAVTVGASGIGLLAEAGLITVAAGPVVIAGLIGAALGLLGWAVIAIFDESYVEQILRGCFFRKDPADRQDALDADNEAVDLRTGFVDSINGEVADNLSLQIAYAAGLTRGFAPSAKEVSGVFESRKVEYTVTRTPNSSGPPAVAADVAFARSITLMNMDLDTHGAAFRGSVEQKIEEELFRNFTLPFTMPTLDNKKPPIEFEVRTTFERETLTFEPMSRAIQRWMAKNVVQAGGSPPSWQPGPPELLMIRERVKAS